MKKILSGFCATALAATFAITSIVPATAAPVFVPRAQTAQSDVINVQMSDEQIWLRRNNRRGGQNRLNRRDRQELRQDRREFRREARQDRREFRREARQDRRQFRRDGYYNGYRGYREYRRGYRRQGDYWYPAAAFLAGALITGAIINNNNNRVYDGGNSHVSWCYDRWQSYRAYDNTYQPYGGPRRICYSPYS